MILVGIDVAKDKHDCFIMDSDGIVLADSFTIDNNREGFDTLFEKIRLVTVDGQFVRVGLEATGHYSNNILGYLLDKGLTTYVINPLHTNLFRKSQSLRKTKTDKVDARTIAKMLWIDTSLKPYTRESYHNEELKSLTRYRSDKIAERGKLKVSISRLVVMLFPELEKMVSSLHLATVYALLSEFPGASFIAHAHLTRLANLLNGASHGRFKKAEAIRIRDAARISIGSVTPAKSLELRHTIALIKELNTEISEIEAQIKIIMDDLKSPILSIPGIKYRMGAAILAEIGDFSRFSSPDKILAFSGLSPSTYQSGQQKSSHAHMEKRGSKYLRFALFNATTYVCHWDSTFHAYLEKKMKEGKHYYVAISHAAKKLVRVIYHLIQTGESYKTSLA